MADIDVEEILSRLSVAEKCDITAGELSSLLLVPFMSDLPGCRT